MAWGNEGRVAKDHLMSIPNTPMRSVDGSRVVVRQEAGKCVQHETASLDGDLAVLMNSSCFATPVGLMMPCMPRMPMHAHALQQLSCALCV